MASNTPKLSVMLDSIKYNLDMATPNFIRVMRDEINPKAGRWIQYQGYELSKGKIEFKFKSSQNSLSFSVYGGLLIRKDVYIPYDEVYEFFKALKQPYIEY